MHISRVVEAVGCTPEELLVVFLRKVGEKVCDNVKSLVAFFKRCAFGSDVSVVEAIVVDGELVHELECSVCLSLCKLHGICFAVGLYVSSAAEHISTVGAHCMPVGHSELKLILHGLSEDYLIGIVVAEGHGIFGVSSFIFNVRYRGEKLFHGVLLI